MMKAVFRGDNVTLRAFEPEDVNPLFEYINHDELVGRRYLPWGFSDEAPLSKKQVTAVLEKWGQEKSGLRLAIVLSKNDLLIGHAGCDWEWDAHCPSISLVICPDQQRKGYGTETMRILLNYLYSHTAAYNVSVWAADWNRQAVRFAEKNGFQQCGRMRWSGLWDRTPFDTIVLDMLRPEWNAMQTGGA